MEFRSKVMAIWYLLIAIFFLGCAENEFSLDQSSNTYKRHFINLFPNCKISTVGGSAHGERTIGTYYLDELYRIDNIDELPKNWFDLYSAKCLEELKKKGVRILKTYQAPSQLFQDYAKGFAPETFGNTSLISLNGMSGYHSLMYFDGEVRGREQSGYIRVTLIIHEP